MLEQAETKRIQDEERKVGVLKWLLRGQEEVAASKQLGVHNNSVLYYLQFKLSQVSNIQKDQQETRLKRHVDRGRLMAADDMTRQSGAAMPAEQPIDEAEDEAFLAQIPPSQRQELEMENKSLLEGFETVLDQVRYVSIMHEVLIYIKG